MKRLNKKTHYIITRGPVALLIILVTIISLILLWQYVGAGLKLNSITHEIGYLNDLNYWDAKNTARYEELMAQRFAIYNSSNPWVSYITTAHWLIQFIAILVLPITFLANAYWSLDICDRMSKVVKRLSK